MNNYSSLYDERLLIKDLFFVEDLDAFDLSKDTIMRFPLGIFSIGLSGTAVLEINTKRYHFSSNNILFILPHQSITVIEKSDNFDATILVANEKLLNGSPISIRQKSKILIRAISNPVFDVDTSKQNWLNRLCSYIKDRILDLSGEYSQQIMQALVTSLFYEVVNSIDLNQYDRINIPSRKEQLFIQFIELITEHYKNEHQVNFYAKQLNITAKYLSVICTTISKRKPSEWIDDNIISEALFLLKESGCSISEVSEELNFRSQSYFTKFFSRKVGMTPSDYKNRI
jgi:AraC-like DNA-binding protein